jgi:3',5'-cyclic AMP phosphodiesterase CpdA
MPSIRLAHLSDVHLYVACQWRLGDWLGKPLLGWLNSRVLGRRRKLFAQAEQVLAQLAEEVHARRPDLVLFSGDAATLGAENEIARVAEILRVGQPGGLAGLAVPGNHDYYMSRAAGSGAFEKHFGPWLAGERIDAKPYPFARIVNNHAVIGLNSMAGKRWFIDSSGRAGTDQIDRLRRLLELPSLAGKRRILMTHYPIARANGKPEPFHRRLRDLRAVLDAAAAGGVVLWLHGHRHHPYVLRPPFVPILSVCAGSGTQAGCWSYTEYALDDNTLKFERRAYDPVLRRFLTAETGEIKDLAAGILLA